MKRAVVIGAFALFSANALAEGVPPPPGSDPHWGDDSITDASPHHRGLDLSVLAWVPWYYGIGIGAQVRLEIPIVPDGFIPSLNDEFDLEPSLGFHASWGICDGCGYFGVAPAVYALYGFHLTRQFRVYAGLGLGYDIGVATCDGCGGYTFGGFYWDPVVGLNFKLSPAFALRAELGAQGLKGGIQFYF